MSKQNKQPLLGLMHALAADAVALQKKFDEHNEHVVAQYRQVREQTDTSMHWMLPSPRQMIVREFQVSARIEWARKESTTASVQVSVPNLSADTRFSRQTGDDSRFDIHVERIPYVSTASESSSSQT